MADLSTTKFISLTNLTDYDELIKTYIGTEVGKALKCGAVVGDVVYFFKEETVPKVGDDVDTSKAAFSFTISSSDITEIKDTLAGYSSTNTVATAIGEVSTKATTNASAIETLNGADTVTGSVAKKIKDAIGDLDNEDAAVAHQFVTAAVQEDGKVTVSRAALTADDIPTLTMDKVSDAGTAAKANVATTAIAEESTDTSLTTAAQVAKFVKDEVAEISGATHFRGTFDALTDVTDPENGDIAIVGAKEYIYVKPDEATAGAWKELGDETIYVTKTTKIAGIDLENDITVDEVKTALGLASAAYTESTAYATAAQGTKADSAVQPEDITLATKAEIEALFADK